jgi:hypothetical protein
MNAPAPLAALAPAGPASTARVSPQLCENCGNEVTQRFCGACGQRREPPVHSLWHFSRVATEDLTHADSRLWRTLAALLFRPGRLTAEFLDGRRARYLPPIRLYLVLSVLFFLVAGAVGTRFAVLQFDDSRPLASANVEAGAQPEDLPALKGQALFKQACRKSVLDNGRELRQVFLHNVPRAMFIFLPLLAGLMMLMYWRPRHYYVEHLLLFVHNHAFVFLVAGMALLLGRLVPSIPGLNFVIFLYFAWYMYRSMRVVYRQGRVLTVSKLLLLASFYLLFASLLAAITSVYSAFML